MAYSKEEFSLISYKMNMFKKHRLSDEEYSDILEKEVFQDERFLNNIRETALKLDLDEEIVYSVITQMILFISSKLLNFHRRRLRINLYGFIYFDCLNPLFEPKSNQYFKKQS